MLDRLDDGRLKTALLLWAVAGLIAGLGCEAFGLGDVARWLWVAGVVPVLVALAVEIIRSLLRGEVGLDIVAALSMSAALIFGESLAAAVVAVMYSGGTFLESFAEGRARREMHALLARVPRTAARYGDAGLADVALDDIQPGDRLLIRKGDVVPVDGAVASGLAVLDMSALTGEPLPVTLGIGEDVLSGGTNSGDAFDLVAARLARDSTFAGIVRLVEQAQASKAKMARLADRWSLGFLAVTLLITGIAWLLSGDPTRAVAVLVIATPCPLILAVPVALVAGLSRAAHFGVLVKGAGPLEDLSGVRTLILDKTGTLTDGRPRLVEIATASGAYANDVLRLAASLDQASHHPVAAAIVTAARERGLVLSLPIEATEVPGEGVFGRVDGHDVAVGGVGFISGRTGAAVPDGLAVDESTVKVAVAIDGRFAGQLLMADTLRPDAAETIAELRRQGIARIVLATGDRPAVAQTVAEALSLDSVAAGLTPERKVQIVQAERHAGPVMMVGDGVNDAPALAAADIGVAMGARGAAAAAEAADVVLLVDQVDRLALAIDIARRSRAIAMQSVIVGIGLSVLGMLVAAIGYLPPVHGAILQEAIDVAVILNALRALRIAPDSARQSRR